MTDDIVKLVTKLRHVDIHNHWLRQEVQANRVNVQWVLTASMTADGLTKPLIGQQFKDYRKAIGLVQLPPGIVTND